MKINQLEILNLASLDREGGEVIRFEEGVLGESNIFSIVGPTGSGKSTILDAICLALYNRAPRYPRKKGEKNQSIEIYGEKEGDEKNRLAPTDSRNILTRGKKVGYSKVTFLANNGTVYRAEWHVRLKQKNYENTLTLLYRLIHRDETTVEEEDQWEKLPQIIGLDYEQFLRTVLIAQGSFSHFLTAKEDERYELLEKLIGNEGLYNHIAQRIKQKKEEAQHAYDEIAARVSAQEEDILPEEELQVLRERIAHLEEAEKKAKEELGRLADALNWYTAEERFTLNLTEYQKQYDIAKQNKDTFLPQSERLALHDATHAAVVLYQEKQTAKTNIETYSRELNHLHYSIAEKEKTIGEQEKALEQLRSIEQAAKKTLEQQRPHINRAREIQVEVNNLTAARNEKRQACLQAAEALKNAKQRQKDYTETMLTQREQMLQQQKQLTERNREIDEQLKGLHTEYLKQEFETLNRAYILMTSENWVKHRSDLKDGEPCPLCGSTHHPYQNAEEVTKAVNDMSKLIDEKRNALNEQTRLQENLSNERNKNAGTLSGLQTTLEQLNELAKRVDTLRLSQEVAERAQTLQQATTALEAAEKTLTEKTTALRLEIGERNPEAYERELTDAQEKATHRVSEAEKAIAQLRESQKEQQGAEKTKQEQKENESHRLEAKSHELELWLNAYNADELHLTKLAESDIALLYSTAENWEGIRAKQHMINDAHTSARTTLEREQKAHEEHQFKKPEHPKDQLLQRKAELENSDQSELIQSKARVQRHDIARKQAGELHEQKLLTETVLNEWKQIADAIGSDGKTLRKIAQCYTLRFLIEHANAEIRKFNSRYELIQVRNSLGIRVIDHDRADDIRDTTSLSGGETFIVSLGLALGLSALSSRNISFENLFIDEGFGTLDPETLATVIDSLAMLQMSQGKKVGVISHTDTMSERITTQIRIVKNGNSGSSHIELYPN